MDKSIPLLSSVFVTLQVITDAKWLEPWPE